MRSSTVFWGLLILFSGLVFLGINLGLFPVFIWEQIWRLWPLILIAIGLRKLIVNDRLFSLISLLLVLGALAWLATGARFGGLSDTSRTDRTNGPGWFQSQRLSGERSTFRSQVDTAGIDRLVVDLGVPSDFTVRATDTPTVSVDLEGPKEIVDQLRFAPDDSRLVLADTDNGPRGWWWFGGNQRITGTVTMPRSLALELDLSGAAKTRLTGHQGQLTINASGASDIAATESMAVNPSIELSGAGKVELDQCNGQATMELSGAGKISAKQCQLSRLSIDSSGTGTVDIGSGTIGDLDIDASGVAKISVPRPTGQNNQDTSGAAKVEFK